MAGNSGKGLVDDFLEQILGERGGGGGYGGGGGMMNMNTVLQLVSGGADGGSGGSGGLRGGMGIQGMRSMGLNLEQQGFSSNTVSTTNDNDNINASDSVHMRSLFPTFGELQTHQSIRPTPPPPQFHQPYHSQQPTSRAGGGPHPPSFRPRVRARRGHATDPHSIAERLRRERIAERMKALQELVPSANKTDRAAMLDEIVDYVKFLRLQVKVLSMSKLGGAGAVAQLVVDVPLSSIEGIESGNHEQAWENWSTDGTEQQVAKLMEEDVGTAMQFLQSKALCIMPISLASAIFPTCHPDSTQTRMVKLESDAPS